MKGISQLFFEILCFRLVEGGHYVAWQAPRLRRFFQKLSRRITSWILATCTCRSLHEFQDVKAALQFGKTNVGVSRAVHEHRYVNMKQRPGGNVSPATANL